MSTVYKINSYFNIITFFIRMIDPDDDNHADEEGDDVEIRIDFVHSGHGIRARQNMDEPGFNAHRIEQINEGQDSESNGSFKEKCTNCASDEHHVMDGE